MTTTGSIIIPAPRIPAEANAPGATFRQTPGGLLVPSSPGIQTPPAARLVVPSAATARDLRRGNVLAEARQGYAELAASAGGAVADLRYQQQLRVIDRVAADERHQEIIDAFMRGRREYSGPAQR